ncbi:MAG: hypothetical protein ACOVT5_16425 [Armatimonadaceae bacterium]
MAQPESPISIAGIIRDRVAEGGERVWRFDDFSDLPALGVAQSLSRMARTGDIERLGRGVYYRGRKTGFGPSRPAPDTLFKIAVKDTPVFPAGLSAAHRLGFTTQVPATIEISTTALHLSRRWIGIATRVRTGRPTAWQDLSEMEGALLEFLRDGGDHSELNVAETHRKTLDALRTPGRFERLAGIAQTEPPRVRALLGALGEILGVSPELTDPLRQSLNRLSRFDFGRFQSLPNAHRWQAKVAPQ